MTDCTFYQGLIGILGTVVGILLGTCIGRYFLRLDKERAYITNAQNVMLTLSTQIRKLENIKRHFAAHESDESRHLRVQSLLISDTEWRLSRSDITMLNSGNAQIMPLIFELIRVNDNFKSLLDSIQDHHRFKDPIDSRVLKGKNEISKVEEGELKRYLDTIYERLEKIELLQITIDIHSYFQKLYPCEIFPKPIIEEPKAEKSN